MGRTGKYTEEFKKKVAKDRVENSLSVKQTAKKYGISNGTVCIWTDMFYDPSEYSSYLALKCPKEVKEQVVTEYLAGKGKRQIAREYGRETKVKRKARKGSIPSPRENRKWQETKNGISHIGQRIRHLGQIGNK